MTSPAAGTRPTALVIGASGQVGHALCARFADGYRVVAASHSHVETGHAHVDLADAASIRELFRSVRPDVVLLAGGICNVDGCELDPARCYQVNVTGTQLVAEQARSASMRVVFFSTDHVFDGAQPSYVESDPTSPMNVYSKSKVAAEIILAHTIPDRHLVIRTSSVYGPDVHRRNFVVRFVGRLSERQSMAVPADQFGSPTFTEDLATAARVLVDGGATGIFHATGPEFVSRDVFAARICDAFGLDASLVEPKATSALRQAAPRARGVRLDCGKLAAAGVPAFATIDQGLARLRETMAWAGVQ